MEGPINEENKFIENQFNSEVPTKVSSGDKAMQFLCQEMNFGLTPKQKATLQAIDDFWHQDITDEKANEFIFQKMKF